MPTRILAVDDESDLLRLVEFNLRRAGYVVDAAADGEEAIRRALDDPPDLVLLDLMLPGLSGLEVCRILRQNPRSAELPIIMLTAKGEDADIVAGLALGADDYVVKPFSPKVLLARIQSVLRRNRREESDEAAVLTRRELTIDPQRFEVRVGEQVVKLTATEFHFLHFLARSPGRVFTRSQIINAVKGSDYPVTDRAVDVQIVGLRKKLEAAGQYIETVRGVGYRFKE